MKKSIILLLAILLLSSQALGFEQEDIDRLTDTNECPQCDLSGAELCNLFLALFKHPKKLSQ